MLKKAAIAKTVSREASLVKRISRRPSFVKREAYLASRKINACERRDTRYEIRVRNDASRARAANPRLQQKRS